MKRYISEEVVAEPAEGWVLLTLEHPWKEMTAEQARELADNLRRAADEIEP